MATGRLPDPNTAPLTAKGDLYTYSTANARLAVGSNGDTLVADSSATTGLRWQGTPAASNPLINSAFDIWQRGTSFAVPTNYTTYTADRYVAYRSGLNSGATISRQSTNDTTNLPFIRYCLRYQRDSGNTATGDLTLLSTLETTDSIRYAGQTITFSFYARRGANYSAASNALTVKLESGTGTDQAINTGFTNQATVISQTATLTTTWQRFSYTGTVGATATQLGYYVFATPTGTAGANDWYEITGFQIDLGSVALPYRRYSATLAGELAACQRYYARNETSSGFTALSGWGMATTTTTIAVNWQLAVPMRIEPVVLEYGNLRATDTVGVASNISTLVLDGTTPTTINLSASGLSGFTQYRPAIIQNRSSGTGYIAVSAEL